MQNETSLIVGETDLNGKSGTRDVKGANKRPIGIKNNHIKNKGKLTF